MGNRSQPIKNLQNAAHQVKPGQTVAPQKEAREPAPYHYSKQELQHKNDAFDASSKTDQDMMEAEKGPGCGHPGCNCAIEMGKHYCSDNCQQVAAKPGTTCQCGHPECGGPLS
jgi:hypothetical protein